MREWSLSQIKHAVSNDNPFEADELVAMLAERQKKKNVLGNLPLIVISRGPLDEEGPQAVEREDAHRKDQAALATLSRADKQIVAAKSGHHVPLDDPGLVASAIRETIQTVRADEPGRPGRTAAGNRRGRMIRHWSLAVY